MIKYTRNAFLSAILFFLLFQIANAQQLGTSGKITFEKKENIHKQFEDDDNSWTQEMLKRMPTYRIDFFQLTFNTHKSLYLLTQEDEGPFTWFKVAPNNTVQINYDTKQYTAEKNIYERSYHIEDSIPQLEWKLLGEYREIAGYNCRKAATIIMDSLYIIAFYSDQIPVSGGPESFSGLPGMILGLVVPRLHLTYFATKIELQSIPETDLFVKASKAKKTNFKAYREELNKAIKDWGEYASKVMWKAAL